MKIEGGGHTMNALYEAIDKLKADRAELLEALKGIVRNQNNRIGLGAILDAEQLISKVEGK